MVTILVALVLGVLLGAVFLIHLVIKPGKSQVTQPTISTKGPRSDTKAEVALHSTRKDCWINVKDEVLLQVYDVTSYLEEHPGGDAILAHAGDDTTERFYGLIGEFYQVHGMK
ncbi:hypothetical protein AMTRI_Chr07g81070 [Amborella trichopoda]